jgi:hypothetical protein
MTSYTTSALHNNNKAFLQQHHDMATTFNAMEQNHAQAIYGLKAMAQGQQIPLTVSVEKLVKQVQETNVSAMDVIEEARRVVSPKGHMINNSAAANSPLQTSLNYLGILTDVVKQVTFWEATGDYETVMNILPQKRGYLPMLDEVTLSYISKNRDMNYGRSEHSVEADIKYQSQTQNIEGIKSGRVFTVEAYQTPYLLNVQNQAILSYGGPAFQELLDQERLYAESAIESLRQFQFKTVLTGIESRGSLGLLNSNTDTSTINTALGWADFTTLEGAQNIANSITLSFMNNTQRYGMPDKGYVSYLQYLKLSQVINPSLTTSGTINYGGVHKWKILEEAFSSVTGKPFKIYPIHHFDSASASDPRKLNLAAGDYSLIVCNDPGNMVDMPLDLMYTNFTAGGINSNGKSGAMYWSRQGEVILGRPQMVQAYRNTNFS